MRAGGRAFHLFQLQQQHQPWRITSTAATASLLSHCTGARRRLPQGFLFTLEIQRDPTLYLCRRVQSSTCEIASEDKLHVDFAAGARGEPLQKREMVGAFQKMPMVMPANDILASAQRKARNVPPTKGIANIAKRERNKGAKQLDALMKELVVPLRMYMENFPKKRGLHPYERSLIELTFGEGCYEQVLGRVDTLRKRIISVGKQHASLCAKSLTKREAEERLNEGRKRLEEAFQNGRSAIDDLVNVAKTLRSMPVVDPQIPTLCLVGAPNVGKSSLVRILSSGKPEICNYPFTTRGVLMGHIVLDHERFQVTDTPGLLTRDDDDRNNIERLTLAVLSYLPTAVLYVHDLSGDCGTSAADQDPAQKHIWLYNESTHTFGLSFLESHRTSNFVAWRDHLIQYHCIHYITYRHIKNGYGDRLWIDVISKCDLLDKSPLSMVDSEDDDVAKYIRCGPEGAIRVSMQGEVGMEELKQRVHQLLTSQMAWIKAERSDAESQGTGNSS